VFKLHGRGDEPVGAPPHNKLPTLWQSGRCGSNAIVGTGLEYVSKTTGNIFRLNGEYYILISGRRFKGATPDGAPAGPRVVIATTRRSSIIEK